MDGADARRLWRLSQTPLPPGGVASVRIWGIGSEAQSRIPLYERATEFRRSLLVCADPLGADRWGRQGRL